MGSTSGHCPHCCYSLSIQQSIYISFPSDKSFMLYFLIGLYISDLQYDWNAWTTNELPAVHSINTCINAGSESRLTPRCSALHSTWQFLSTIASPKSAPFYFKRHLRLQWHWRCPARERTAWYPSARTADLLHSPWHAQRRAILDQTRTPLRAFADRILGHADPADFGEIGPIALAASPTTPNKYQRGSRKTHMSVSTGMTRTGRATLPRSSIGEGFGDFTLGIYIRA